jgi:C4-dicarboxylate-binding protein DctP
MLRKMFTLTSLGVVAIGMTIATTGTAPAATKMIMSNYTQASTVKGKTFELLRATIAKDLKGEVDVELHQAGTLFSQKTEIQGLQLGSTHLIAPTTGIYSSISKKINAMLLPYLLSTPEAIDKAVNDPLIRETFFKELEAKNVLPLTIWINGPRNISYKAKKAILVPKDMKGLKIRVQPAAIFVKTMEAFGANVISMNWGEVPAAIQQGVIDAAEPTPNATVSSKIYQLVDHVTLHEYIYSYYIVGTNKQWWEGLPAGTRGKLKKALKKATEWNWANTVAANEKAYKIMSDYGVKIHKLNATQRQAWVDAVKPVWKELGNAVVGDKVMSRLKEIGGVK